MNEMEETEKPYTKLEFFFYALFIPIVFAIALFIIIGHFSGYNVVGKALEVGHKVPGLSSILPAKEEEESETAGVELDKVLTNLEEAEDRIKNLIAEKAQLEESVSTKEAEIEALQNLIKRLEESASNQTISSEEYHSKVQELAKLYGGMSAGKAAPIIQNLTLMEAALILDRMNNTQRAGILAKMDPAFAAKLTVTLKEMDKVDHPEMAALQERIQLLMQESNVKTEGTKNTLTIDQMANTFNQMPAGQAAGILTEMSATTADFNLATRILANMNEANRSTLIAAMPTEIARRYTKALVN